MKNILKKFYHKINKNYQLEYLFKKELSYFENSKNILDIGCGNGNFIKLDPKRIIGLDSNKESLLVCKRKKFKVFYGNATSLPFNSKVFEGVHCSHIIEHLYPDKAYKMLQEIARVLKENGVLVLSSPLLWEGFYNNFTHIKPYNPESILRYLVDEGEEKTFCEIKDRFMKIDLYWRFRLLKLPTRFGYLLSNFLYQFGVHTLLKDAYTLVVKKI